MNPSPLTPAEWSDLQALCHPTHSGLYVAVRRLRDRGEGGEVLAAADEACRAVERLRGVLLRAWAEAEPRPVGRPSLPGVATWASLSAAGTEGALPGLGEPPGGGSALVPAAGAYGVRAGRRRR